MKEFLQSNNIKAEATAQQIYLVTKHSAIKHPSTFLTLTMIKSPPLLPSVFTQQLQKLMMIFLLTHTTETYPLQCYFRASSLYPTFIEQKIILYTYTHTKAHVDNLIQWC